MLEAKSPKEYGGIGRALEVLKLRVGELGDRVLDLRQRLIPFLATRKAEENVAAAYSDDSCSPVANFVFRQVARLDAYIATLCDIIRCLDLTEEGVAQLMSWDKQADNANQ